MNQKILWALGLTIFLLCMIVATSRYGSSMGQENITGNANYINNLTSTITASSPVDRIEVYHFHGIRQCPTCIRIGNLTELTVKNYFQKEIDSGKLIFAHINVELPENAPIAEKYGATGSSLMIGVYRKDGSFSKEEDTAVWYKMGNQGEYLAYMKGIIEQKFSGN